MSEVESVLGRAKQSTETERRDWHWVEADIWTERMLAALENGVKGGKEKRPGRGHCLNDHRRWPNAFFAQQGLFTLTEAHAVASRSRC
jgi:hypothetical protein